MTKPYSEITTNNLSSMAGDRFVLYKTSNQNLSTCSQSAKIASC